MGIVVASAPLSLADILTNLRMLVCFLRRSAKTLNSLPKVVGEAGCPCVRASIGKFLYFLAITSILPSMEVISGV